jgi:Transposase DDE domain
MSNTFHYKTVYCVVIKMNIDKLIEFFKFFKSVVEKMNNESLGRTKLITFTDIIYCCLYMNGNSYSYSMTNLSMFVDNIIDVSDVAFKNKRNTVGFIPFKNICKEMLNFVYNGNNTPRIIGVDGTYIPLSIELQQYGYPTSKKNTYCIGLISSLFDLNEKYLINYRLCKNHNERDGLISQMKYLKSGDTLIMDRGYYSENLLFSLNKEGIKVIFRLKKNMLMVKKIIEKGQASMNTNVIHNNESIEFRIITYQINNNNYFLGTTIMNHKVNYFKDLYWKRWSVEINFRESKYLLSLDNILSKNPTKVKQDIYIHNILFLIHSFCKNHIQKTLPSNKFINTKNLFSMIINKILYLVLYNKITISTKETIERICSGLLKTLTTKASNRHYERIRIKPIGKWYYCIKHDEKINQ